MKFTCELVPILGTKEKLVQIKRGNQTYNIPLFHWQMMVVIDTLQKEIDRLHAEEARSKGMK